MIRRKSLFWARLAPGLLLMLPVLVSGVCVAADKPSPRPASTVEAIAAIDMSKLAMLPKSTSVIVQPTQLYYQAPGTRKDALDFHKAELTKAGWSEVEAQAEPITPAQSFATAFFAKNGFYVSVFTNVHNNFGAVFVTISNLGNIDARQLTYPAGAELRFANPGSVEYLVTENNEVLADKVEKTFREQGWIAGKRRDGHRFTGHIQITMYQGGMTLMVNVEPAGTKEKRGSSLKYTLRAMPCELPIPTDATDLDYSTSPPSLTCNTEQDREKIVAFYEKSLKDLGWTKAPKKDATPSFGWKAIYTNPARDRLRVEFVSLGSTTLVTLLQLTEEEAASIGAN